MGKMKEVENSGTPDVQFNEFVVFLSSKKLEFCDPKFSFLFYSFPTFFVGK